MLPRLWLLVGSKGPTKGPRDRPRDQGTNQGTKGPIMSVIELSWTAKNIISVTDISIQSAVSVFFSFSESIQFWQHLLIILQFAKKVIPNNNLQNLIYNYNCFAKKTEKMISKLCKTMIQNNNLPKVDPESTFCSRKNICRKIFGRTICKKKNDLEQQIRLQKKSSRMKICKICKNWFIVWWQLQSKIRRTPWTHTKKRGPKSAKKVKKLLAEEFFGINNIYLQQSKKCSSDVKPL